VFRVGLAPRPVRSFQNPVDEISSPVAAVIAPAISPFVRGAGASAGHLFWTSHSIRSASVRPA